MWRKARHLELELHEAAQRKRDCDDAVTSTESLQVVKEANCKASEEILLKSTQARDEMAKSMMKKQHM